MNNPVDLAYEVRIQLGANLDMKIPAAKLENLLGYKGQKRSLYQLAVLLGLKLETSDPIYFADTLLCPLYLLEPLVKRGVKTGERYFFGLFEKRRSWTILELAEKFNCPCDVVSRQCAKLF